MSFKKLIENIDNLNCPIVAGLDPKLDMIPKFILEQSFEKFGNTFEAAADALFTFNKGLIDSFYDLVPAVKPQAAYYEMYGWQGVKALQETIDYAKNKGLFVITDGKRNDIDTTMQAYITAHLGKTDLLKGAQPTFNGDALTVNAYLGYDGIKPAITACEIYDKAIFVLVKTSNKSSGELQDLTLSNGSTVYKHMGQLVEKWGAETNSYLGYSAVGAVVGATYPAQLVELRAALPHTFFLVPGYGAQGGGAADIIGAFDSNHRGAIINSSRAIMCAYKKAGFTESDYQTAAREEVLLMKQSITTALN